MNDESEFFFIGIFICAIVCAFLPSTAVDKVELEFAESSCISNGGLKYTRGSGAIRSQVVVCNNGAAFKRTVNVQK